MLLLSLLPLGPPLVLPLLQEQLPAPRLWPPQLEVQLLLQGLLELQLLQLVLGMLLQQQLEEVQQQLQLLTSPCAPLKAILQTCEIQCTSELNLLSSLSQNPPKVYWVWWQDCVTCTRPLGLFQY
jgi:hypothetical protein